MFLKLVYLLSIIANLVFVDLSQACSVCFNNVEDDPGINALKWSMICMLGVLLVVLGLFAKFFLTIRKKEKLSIQKH